MICKNFENQYNWKSNFRRSMVLVKKRSKNWSYYLRGCTDGIESMTRNIRRSYGKGKAAKRKN